MRKWSKSVQPAYLQAGQQMIAETEKPATKFIALLFPVFRKNQHH